MSPQCVSPQNWLMMPDTTGPRHATGASSEGSSRFTDMTLMPLSVWAGKMPSMSATTCPVMPNVLGMDGPVTSASRMPTLKPRFCIWLASRLVTSDLPTPPLPLTTAMTCLMLLCASVGSVVGPCSVRSPQPATPQLPHSCVHSSAMENLLCAPCSARRVSRLSG